MQIRHLSTLLVPLLVATGCDDLGTGPARTPTELRVSPEMVRVLTGEKADFQVELVDENGEVYETIPSWAPPVWSSNRPDRVELSGATIIPVRGGEQTLHVELAGLEATAVLRANPAVLGVSVPIVHITQSVQRAAGDVPVVAGRDGLLRVVVNGDDENYYRPRVRASFYHGETPVHSAEMELGIDGLPISPIEGDLSLSYNADVPGEVLQPGVSVVIDVDPEGVVPAGAGSTLRIPETGTLDLEVREVPPFRLTVVPVEQAAFPDRRPRFTPSFAEQVLRLTNDLFPFDEFDLHVRDPYVTAERLDTEEGWFNLIEDIVLLRWDDGSARYYYGGFNRPPGTTIGGLGYVGYPVAIGMDDRPDVIAHEIGHNLSLRHAPCGNPAGPDRAYPYRNGIIGQYGYDRSRQRLRDREMVDVMSYCSPVWISDYNYEKVVAYRDTSAFDVPSADGRAAMTTGEQRVGEQRVLVVRGGVFDGHLRIEPALEWSGLATPPPPGGRYSLEGFDAGGARIFSIPVEPQRLDHHDSSQFLVALPAGMAEPERLERLRLSGPEGVVERARSSRMFRHLAEVRLEGNVGRWNSRAFPLAVVRDRGTGLIRAMSRTGVIALPESGAADFEVLLSDGLATRPARVMQQ